MRSASQAIIIALVSWLLCLTPAHAGWFEPSSYEECLIDKIPDASTDQAAYDLRLLCERKYPKYSSIKSGPGILGPTDYDSCISKYINGAKTNTGAKIIRYACRVFSKPYNQPECKSFFIDIRKHNPNIRLKPNFELYDWLLTQKTHPIYSEFRESCL